MVGSALTLAIIGLGAVGRALPAPTPVVKDRQIFGIGGGNTPPPSFTWGPGGPTSTCIATVPTKDQPPCIPAIIGGGLTPPGNPPKETPPKAKRFWLPPDYDKDTKKAIDTIEKKLEALQNKKHKTDADYDEIDDLYDALNYLAGITNISAPPGSTVVFHPGKKAKRFWLPPDYDKDTKKAIDTIEKKLEALQNKPHKTDADYDEIDDLYDALNYLAGITNISAPPGSTVVFHPGKKAKRFWLPPDYDKDTKKAIDTLEKKLEALQNKKHKTDADYDEIDDIYDALNYLAGITNISAPPGSTVVFHPGKRSALPINNGKDCSNLSGAELALEGLMHSDKMSPQEHIIMEKLKSYLLGCGITIIKSPDGTTTTLQPSNKRSSPPFNLAGIEKAYEILVQSVGTSQPSLSTYLAIEHLASILRLYGIKVEKTPTGTTTTLVPGKRQITIGQGTCQLADVKGFKGALAALLAAYGPPSQAPWNVQLIEQVIVETLRYCGESVDGWTGPLVPNPTIPGGPIVPDPTVPGGPIVPDPTVPGGPIVPDPTVPGGPITPDPSNPGAPITPDPSNPGAPITPDPTYPGSPMTPSNRRQVLLSDPSALLAALKQLEDTYGHYGSGTIPLPIFIIMENMVVILQAIPGVIVPGWPTLGSGSMVPSN